MYKLKMNIDSSVSETAPENWVVNITDVLKDKEAETAPENWVVNITKMLKNKEAMRNTPVCILKVRKVLRDIKPEDYTPQLIGLGPYHHWRADLYEMELYKLIAAKKAAAENEQAVQTLGRLVDRLTEDLIAQIRACYDRYLEVGDKELAWMMVIDSIFLLQFLQVFVHKEHGKDWSDHKRMSYLVDPTQSAFPSIQRDMMMLENQIPTIALKHIFSDHIFSDLSDTIQPNNSLLQLLSAACKKLSPFQHQGRTPFDNTKPSHLLELLYYMIVPRNESYDSNRQEDCPPPECQQQTSSKDAQASTDSGQTGKCLPEPSTIANVCGSWPGKLNWQAMPRGPVKSITRLIDGLLATIVSCSSGNSSSGRGHTKSPTVEEIEIPSASELLNVGVKFCPKALDGCLITDCIFFDKTSRKFELPVIDIDDNTEVIMRNLVAYEAAAVPGPLVLARYTELMNGIIDTAEDVSLLRNKGIIKRNLKSDKDVANMWNLMSRSIRLSPVYPIDKAIKEVNEYYASKKRIRFCRFTKACMFCAWKTVMLVFALLLFMLMFIQSFCDVYRCTRIVAAIEGSGSQGTN